MICPECHGLQCAHRSHRRGPADYTLTVFGLRPWRCHSCEARFYAGKVLPVSLSVYAHCPRCGRTELEKIAGRLVASGPVSILKRFLGFAAYRCDPCREKFFTMRPYHPIHPKIVVVRKHKPKEHEPVPAAAPRR